MDQPIDTRLLGERVRMARAKLNEGRPTFAERFGLGEGTLRRVEAGTASWKDYELEGFIARVVAETGLPREFFTVDDFSALAEPTTDLEVLAEVVGILRELQRRIEIDDRYLNQILANWGRLEAGDLKIHTVASDNVNQLVQRAEEGLLPGWLAPPHTPESRTATDATDQDDSTSRESA